MTGAGVGFLWKVGLVAGLQVGQALGCSGRLGLGSAVLVPQVPGHTTSMYNKGVNSAVRTLVFGLNALILSYLLHTG